ncbi:DUF1877 family protein [Phytomonospora sp. NPDC050363]|uniref:DUF1877 family protein n=1 Tax=Phytomonospora sp. NPDC050363 TaxID=3155642 RepID=UPI0033DFF360
MRRHDSIPEEQRMGMVMSFTAVTAAEAEKAAADPDWARDLLWEDGRRFAYLDKAWAGLDHLFGAAGLGVRLMVEETIDEDGTLEIRGPQEVAATAELLGRTPFTALAHHFDGAAMTAAAVYPSSLWEDGDDAIAYLNGHYQGLADFFRAAATAKAAVIAHFSY